MSDVDGFPSLPIPNDGEWPKQSTYQPHNGRRVSFDAQ